MGNLTDSEQAAVAQQLIPALKQMKAEFDQLAAKGLLAAFNPGQNSPAGLVLPPVLKQMRAEFDQLAAKGLLAAFNLGQNSPAGLVLPPGASVTIGPFTEEK